MVDSDTGVMGFWLSDIFSRSNCEQKVTAFLGIIIQLIITAYIPSQHHATDVHKISCISMIKFVFSEKIIKVYLSEYYCTHVLTLF